MQPNAPLVDEAPVPAEQSFSVVQPAVPIDAPQQLAKKIPKQRHFLILFFFSFMWGSFGVDRMYMGLWGTGILKLLTFGGFGFWTLSDFIIVMTGTFQDKQGRVALQAEEYKKFAGRTVFWFAVILGLFILLNGILLILGIFQAAQLFQGGGINNIPGLSGLSGGGDQSEINSLLGQ